MMLNNNKLFSLTLLFIFLFAGISVFAAKQDVSAVEAMQLFDRGEFEAAETAFRQLLIKPPGNTMLNYYYGASRTENGHYSQEDLNRLLEAGQNVTPHRINYYIGIQHHAQNNFEQALKYYNRFRLEVPEEERQELQLAQKIQQCFDRENPFQTVHSEKDKQTTETTAEAVPVQTAKETGETATETEQPAQEESPVNVSDEKNTPAQKTNTDNDLGEIISTPRRVLPDLPGVKTTYTPPDGEPIEFQINDRITYLNTAHFQTEKGKDLFQKGKSLQQEVKQNMENADALRNKYQNAANAEEKVKIGEQILDLENESYELRSEATQLFSESRSYENQYWQHAGEVAVTNFLIELDKMQHALHPETEKVEPANNTMPLLIADSDLFDSTTRQQTEKKETNENNLVYKIQIGAYSRGLPAYVERLYKKLSLIRKIENYTDENGVVVYTTGNLKNLEDAVKMQNQVRREGVEDAFVVPYFKGKRITLEEAKKLEAENDIERN
jgi:hypothetical protein